MALLQKFQADIEDINKKNIEEQRAAIALQQEKERKDSKSKQALAQEPASKETTPVDNAIDIEVLLDIQTLLLSESEADHSKARDSIAAAVTRQRGECIVLFGRHPLPGALYAATGTLEESASDNTWTGQHLSEAQLKQIVSRLSDVVDQIGGRVTQLFEHHTRTACLIRIPPLTLESTPEVRVGVVGNVDSGKSTTLGVLTRGGLDDGRGRARVALFRHKHEIETGRTSSVGMEILGFGPSGQPILPSADVNADPDVIRRERLGWEQIVSKSSKIVSFIDLAGHEKYLKTTLYGLTSGAPSCVILMVGANTGGLIGMSKEHLAITLALSVPVAVVISKIDMTPANVLQETIKQLVKVLKSPGSRKTPVFVNSFEIATQVSQEFVTKRLCPIFQVSNVTGEGLDKLRQFLNLLPSSEDESRFSKDMPFEYSVTEVWSVPYTGVVVNGIINSGRITAGDPILIGPDSVGNWIITAVKSIHRKRAPVTSAEAGQSVSFALKKVKKGVVRKGMVIIAKTDAPPKAVRRFEGQVLILYHNTTLSRNYQAMLHCGNIRQTVRIIDMDNPAGILRTGDRATVQFEFIKNPEFIKPGQKLLFREGVEGSIRPNNLEPSGLQEVDFSLSPSVPPEYRYEYRYLTKLPFLLALVPPVPKSRKEAPFCSVPSRSLPPTAPSRIHIRSMSQPTKTSALQTVVGIKAGNEGVKASPSASRPVRPMIVAIEGEDPLTYLQKMVDNGGLAGMGESELQASGASAMESVHFPHFPASVHIALFNNVKNAKYLRTRLVAASTMDGEDGEQERAAVNFGFIDGRLITSRALLETAVHQALLTEERGSLRTHYVHSEILWVLNPSNNISDAIRRFGVNDTSTTLVVVKVLSGLLDEESKKSILTAMQAVVEGELLPLSSLSDFTDWIAVKKLYKMGSDAAFQYATTTEDQHTLIDRIVINTVAIKAVSG